MVLIVGVGDAEEDGENSDDEDVVTWSWAARFGFSF